MSIAALLARGWVCHIPGVTRLRASEATYERPPGVDASSVVSVFRVPPELAGQRLDVFVQGQLRRTSRTRTQAIIVNSAFDAEGRPLRANDRVRAEQLVLLWRAPWDESPVPTDIGILFEDDHLLAVDKPPLLPVHPTARYYRNTLIRLLHDARPGAFLSLGHRLDRETSGVLLVAKTRECERALKRQLAERNGVRKTYVALTWGIPVPPDGASGARFRYERSLELDTDSWLRVKMRLGRTPAALFAATTFEVVARAEANGRVYARVRCDLETGRQHQIRLHLAALGTPVVGDKLYGPDERLFVRGADEELTAADHAVLEVPRHALHAAEIALPHPITGEPLLIVSPLAKDLEAFWQSVASP
jgi:23S rRNA pseudouridine1911/1915/1917 synthase